VHGTLLSEQESRISTIKKMYSIKKVQFDTFIDLDVDIFSSTTVPVAILQVSQQIFAGGSIVVSGGSGSSTSTINAETMAYLVNLSDRSGNINNSTTVTVSAVAAINPTTTSSATKNEFDVYINGQYIDKDVYTWTPSEISLTQTIVFDTNILGYTLTPEMIIIVNGRWA